MNKKNRLAVWLCLVLTVLMVVSAIPAGAISVSVAGVTTPEQTVNTPNGAGEIDVNTGNPALDDSVPVGNPGEGYTPVGIAINSAEDFNNMEADGKYYLAADITIEKTYAGFEGVFDGNGHTVYTTVPLFNAPQSATIKNLIVADAGEDTYITATSNTAAVASGTSFECNFFNILNKATVLDPNKNNENAGRVSGIAGRTSGYTIFERCTNEGKLSGYGISGGITALVSADDGSYAVFINCVNKGTVETAKSGAAGIACGVEGPAGTTLFYNCRNEGNVTAEGAAGGIVSYANLTAKTTCMRFVNCTNSGEIVSTGNVAGGIVGVSNIPVTIENCTNTVTGKITSGTDGQSNQDKGAGIVAYTTADTFISGCKNYAYIDGAGQSGGIAGWLNATDITIQNCENYGDVTSRLNYAGGITARADNGATYYNEITVVISDCKNEGNITAYNGNVAGIVAYSQSPVTIIRCTNKGNVGARSDVPNGNGVPAGGIAGGFSCPLTVIDCRNEGTVTAKATYTVDADGNVTAQSGGVAGGIIGSAGNAAYFGATRVIGCVNTGEVKSGESKMATVANNMMYAGGLVGYQYCNGYGSYLVAQYCVNTGNVTGASNAGYVLGYMNGPVAIITCNVLAGKLTSTCFPEGVNANGSSVLNALTWNNENILLDTCYSNNYVVDTFEGTMLNNKASTDAGTPVGMDGYISYRFSETDDPFEIMDLFVKEDSPRDEVTLITSADEFLAMSQIGNYKLANDITLNATYGEGLSDGYQYFFGTLDGAGHTITVNGVAAFTAFGVGAVISNLTIKGTAITYAETVGALGRYGGATFINIHNTVDVTATVNNAGGIIGSTAGATARFENCTNTGKINSTSGSAGGITGYSNGVVPKYIDCVNSGEVTSSGTRAGGIVGESQTANTVFINCVNTGKITCTKAGGNSSAGGILAYNGTNYVMLRNCLNQGEVNGTVYAGGIVGDSAKGLQATNCVNTGNITATEQNAGGIFNHHSDTGCTTISATGCINAGTVIAKNQAGGIAGESQQIKNDATNKYKHTFKSCINIGDVTGGSTNTGAIAGYIYAGGSIGFDVQDCIAAGTVTGKGARAGALVGYSNTTMVTIKNNVVAAKVTATTATHLFYATGTSAATAKANISGNVVVPGSAMYGVQTGQGAKTYSISESSTDSVTLNDFAIDSTVTGAMLMAAGITPDANGSFGSALDLLLSEENRTGNKVAIINAAGETVATVGSVTEAAGYLTEGATLKLMADYYTAIPENVQTNGISYVFDGNGYSFYGSNTGKYMLNFNGTGTVHVTGLTMRTQGASVKVGLSPRNTALTVTFENLKIYAGGASENGYFRCVDAKGLYVDAPSSTVNITGSETVFKSAKNIAIQSQSGVLNINAGTFMSRIGALETWGKEAVVNIYGGNFVGNYNFDCVVTSGLGTINIFDGRFTNNGMCVARVLGNKTKNENGADNTITTENNATLNIFGGTLIALSSSNDAAHHAVVRCGGGTTYGVVNIAGGTFVNQKAASYQVIFKNNTCSSLFITGGKFLASDAQKRFLNTNGCADVTTDSGYRPAQSHQNVAVSSYSADYTFEGNTYKIWTIYGATDSKYAMTTESGAQVRMTAGSTGLRFISTITAEKVAAAKALAGTTGTVSYGTVIAPVDYVLRADAFTMAALDEALTNVSAGKRYVDIEAKDGLTEDEDGNVEIRAALTNIKEGNLTRAFAAVSYVKVVDADGNATYYYSEFDAVENVRAIRQVAEAALADTNETQEGAYIYAILDDEGNVVAYSRYSDSERDVLKTFTA